jgi:hypothetical protein
MDLSAGDQNNVMVNPMLEITGAMHTTKEQPKSSAADLRFNGVQAFVRRLFVHTQCDGDMGGLTEGCVLCRIVSFTKVVDTVTMQN